MPASSSKKNTVLYPGKRNSVEKLAHVDENKKAILF